MPIMPMYPHPLHGGALYQITSVAYDVTGQENMDGEPYDLIMALAEALDDAYDRLDALED